MVLIGVLILCDIKDKNSDFLSPDATAIIFWLWALIILTAASTTTEISRNIRPNTYTREDVAAISLNSLISSITIIIMKMISPMITALCSLILPLAISMIVIIRTHESDINITIKV